MKFLSVATAVVMLSVGVAAQGPGKGTKAKSSLTVTVASLNCSTGAGSDSFEAQAWSWGASNSTDFNAGGGGGAGKATINDLSVTRGFDACSPALFGAVVTGKAFPTLTLTQANADGTVTTLTLSEVHVTSWQASGSVAAEAAGENVSFTFSKVCLVDGTSGGKFCYDIKANKIL